ncbi:MAG: S8 family serine peptidase [Flavobacteriales bacterium]|nr:S8 family serine peptidase [Flavobacteriales bacterium]
MRILITLLFIPFLSWSQEGVGYKLWIGFSDKGSITNTSYSASDLLSERSIARRDKQNISIDYSDYPLSSDYLNTLKNLNFEVLNKSKWFNGVTALQSDSNAIDSLVKMNFIQRIDTLGYFFVDTASRYSSKFDDIVITENTHDAAKNQIEMIGGMSLHAQGYQGQGMHIAVFDSGFRNANTIDAFSHLYTNNQILGTWDYVDREFSVYEDNYHGMSVLSTMGGYLEDEFLGTAPKASYWLLRTEDVSSETLIEEYNWAVAAEFADSVGADIINSSLGYTTFDYPWQDHSYADMDGKTTVISRAATMASRKGIIVCNSAGNSGNSNWKYIGAPADADSILSVGSVDGMQEVSSFSSYGPTSDGRVKPSVSAQGGNTAIITQYNSIATSNGTSFSSPVIAGMTACLWQAHYDKSNMQIIDAIIQSAHLYEYPDEQLGFGIPNYALANALLLDLEDVNMPSLEIYPNPTYSDATVYIYSANESEITYRILDLQGKLVDKGEIPWSYSRIAIDLPSLKSGVYVVEVKAGASTLTERLSVIQ